MNKTLVVLLTGLLMTACINAVACEYIRGETKYADWAKCKYGPDAVLQVDLPESHPWGQCVYQDRGFGMVKLLAVTRTKEGKEELSTFDRSQLGNPCYMMQQACENAREAQQ